MKDLVPFGGDNLISILTAISLLLPIGAILVRRSMWRWSLAALVVYYFQFFLFSFFPENYVSTGDQPIQLIQFSHVLIDLPLVLLFMHFFAEDGRTRSRIRRSLMGWVAWSIILIATMGLTQRITPYLMGPGILLAVAFSVGFFVKHLQSGIHDRWETGKAFMAGSLVFLYGSYLVIFFIRYVMKLHDEGETYLLFQVSTLISAWLMTAGLILNRKRPQKRPLDDKARDRNIILTNWGDFQFK